MKRKIMYVFLVTVALLLSATAAGCRSEPEYPYRITLEEAGEIMEAPLPVPAYLPDGYEIKGIFLREKQETSAQVLIFISDKNVDIDNISDMTDMPEDIVMKVSLYRKGQIGGLKLVGEWYKIGDTMGVLVSREKYNDLWWLLPHPVPPGEYELALSATKDIPNEELVEIARSVNSDG